MGTCRVDDLREGVEMILPFEVNGEVQLANPYALLTPLQAVPESESEAEIEGPGILCGPGAVSKRETGLEPATLSLGS